MLKDNNLRLRLHVLTLGGLLYGIIQLGRHLTRLRLLDNRNGGRHLGLRSINFGGYCYLLLCQRNTLRQLVLKLQT